MFLVFLYLFEFECVFGISDVNSLDSVLGLFSIKCPWFFQANLWIIIFSYVGNYFWTHYFFRVLGASYTFPSWRMNNVMFYFMYIKICFTFFRMCNSFLRMLSICNSFSLLNIKIFS